MDTLSKANSVTGRNFEYNLLDFCHVSLFVCRVSGSKCRGSGVRPGQECLENFRGVKSKIQEKKEEGKLKIQETSTCLLWVDDVALIIGSLQTTWTTRKRCTKKLKK